MKTDKFKEDKLLKAFRLTCDNGQITVSKLAKYLNTSTVSAYRILKALEEAGCLKSSVKHRSDKRGKPSVVYSLSSVSILIYDLTGEDISVSRYFLKSGKSTTTFFKYKNVKSNTPKLEYLIEAQKKFTVSDKKTLSSVYLIDGVYDRESDRILSSSYPELENYSFSQLSGNRENCTVLHTGELLADYFSDIVKGTRTLFVSFEAEKKRAYLFEGGHSILSADIDLLQKLPFFGDFPMTDFSKRAENIANLLSLFNCLYNPDTVCVSTPYIGNTTDKIRKLFTEKEILFMDSFDFKTETAVCSYVKKRLTADMLISSSTEI